MSSKGTASRLFAALLASLATATPLRADYESHPELRPETRCAGLDDPDSPTGYGVDCQALFWDLSAATHVGERALAAPDPVTGFPLGRTDRPPPLYTDGTEGYEQPGPGRVALCPLPGDPSVRDPDLVPWWKPTGETETIETPFGPSEAEYFEVACRRGTRASFGPWRVDPDPTVFDAIARAVVRFENRERLDRDVAAGRTTADRRVEMNVSSESYAHTANHHIDCYTSLDACNDPDDPEHAASAECADYQARAEQCPADDPQPGCSAGSFNVFRITTARPGRYLMDLPEGRGFPVVENPLWSCNQHTVSDLPPTRDRPAANLRRQAGGPIGEVVFQYFTEPISDDAIGPISIWFLGASNLASNVPPFTMGIQTDVFPATTDMAIAMLGLHAHDRMVKATINASPVNPPRPAATNPSCGAGVNLYETYHWDTADVCEYWREPDGPVILREGQSLHAECVVNNGVTPTDQIEDPALRAAVEASPVGEALYGRQPPEAYRVRYACEEIPGLPPGGSVMFPGRPCPPNPVREGPLDTGYDAPDHCPTSDGTGRCVPASAPGLSDVPGGIMCIAIVMYWPLD